MATRAYVEDELVERVQRSIPAGSGPTTASIDSFPFLGRLAVTGRIERLTVHQGPVEANGIRFAGVDVDLRGVRIDRGRLVRNRAVELDGIDRGTVRATIAFAELGRLAGEVLTGGVRIDDGVLVIGDVRIDLLGVPLVPCATRLRFEGASVVLTCTIQDPPAELLRAVPSLR